MIPHINRIKEGNFIIVLIETEELNKIQFSLSVKTL